MRLPTQSPAEDKRRELKPEFAEILQRVGPKYYGVATARLHANMKQPARRRFARM